ncbi:DUF3263 domain-containing protein [Nocardioides aurantiacus]|uniref:Uncharacterized protein DUF3263 n=1 Tax=Nocardioides aurantiacus TaxID=86796 RepID=A0A3N2CX49_9ACTN|nr:DUF3263 domain-containing protein [Nocardioides aurantiacus]ROR91794.1 uncharacterized protein DUF3263 [Nocardioides aurantiacus]
MGDLTDTHRAIIDFERDHPVWRYPAAKETAVRQRFGMTAARYYQVLGWVIEQQEAVEYAPWTANRLRRLTEKRREARSSSRGE